MQERFKIGRSLPLMLPPAALYHALNMVGMRPAWWRSGKTSPEVPSRWRAPAFEVS